MDDTAPQISRIIDMMPRLAGDPRPPQALSPAENRARMRRVWVDFWNQNPPFVETVRDLTVETAVGKTPVRVYDPGSDGRAPIVYFHGGAFVMGDLDTDDAIARRLALYSGRPLVSVDYRLAPENPYPAPLDDCVEISRVLDADRRQFGLGDGPFALVGSSAGAHLALATALRLRDDGGPAPAAMLLMIGNFDPKMRSEAYRRYGSGYLLANDEIAWGWQQYLGDRLNPPVYAALLDIDLAGLAPVYVGAAECDPLVGDSLTLETRLRAAQVPTELHVWPGMTHACIAMSRELNQADHQIADAAVWLARTLAARRDASVSAGLMYSDRQNRP